MLNEIVAAACGAAAFVGCWQLASWSSFRESGDDRAVGPFPGIALCLACLAAVIAGASASPYVSSPWAAGLAIGALAVCVVTDLRSRTLPNTAVLLIAGAGIVDALSRGYVVDALAGAAFAGAIGAVCLRARILAAGDVKAMLAIGFLVGGFGGLLAAIAALLALLLVHAVRQARSKVPLVTTVPLGPFLAAGYALAFGMAVSPLARLLVVGVR